jgi:predicted DNA-binding antitoxin AbrB/MazE fold protein
MSASNTIDAVYENGVLRPVQPLTLKQDERVTITVHGASETEWPEDAAEIYKELEAEDRKLAAGMWPGVKATWPT